MRKELLEELIKAIGCRIAQIGEDIQDSVWGELNQHLEQLRRLIDAAEAAEKMKRI